MSVFVVRPTDRTSVAQGPVFDGFRRKHKNTSGHRRHFPEKGYLRRQAINLAPPKRVRAWGDGPQRLEYAGGGAPDMNAGFPESMSDGLDSTATGTKTYPTDQCTDQYGRPKCVPAQLRSETVHTRCRCQVN